MGAFSLLKHRFAHGLAFLSKKKGLLFHLGGILAIAWFLFRVLPKPDRIRYPCQQMSLSVALGYLAFWSGLFVLLSKSVRSLKFRSAKVAASFVVFSLIAVSLSGMVFAWPYFFHKSTEWDPQPYDPIGSPLGARPGRVVWVWDPNATEEELDGFWWEAQNNNQSVLDSMMSQGIRSLTGSMCDRASWEFLFRWFNLKENGVSQPYEPGEKIAIKINMNNGYFGDYDFESMDVDANPYVVKALLSQLIDVVGVAPEDITVYDSSRKLMDWFFYRVYYEQYPADDLVAEFEGVNFVDSDGSAWGREKAVPSEQKIHFAGEDDFVPTLPVSVVEADYLINMPIAKRHIDDRVTLAAKNWFGSWIEEVVDVHPYHEASLKMGEPTPQTDLTAHEQLGQKTFLYIGDGTFGCRYGNSEISKFQMYPFNGDWMSSLFFSQDPVAIDSVMWDFFYMEGTGPGEDAHNYLHESAMPPEGRYDPEGDGSFVNFSLGVHEHADYDAGIFSEELYGGPDEGGIEFVPVINGDLDPSVSLIKPRDHRLYLFNREIGLFPFHDVTIVIGTLDVEAEVFGIDQEDLVGFEFFVDGNLVASSTDSPVFSWSAPVFGKHYLSVHALLSDESVIESQSFSVYRML